MSDEAERFFAWRDTEKRKPRAMTWAEYRGWCRSGDALDDHTSNSAFLGGLTIDFGSAQGPKRKR